MPDVELVPDPNCVVGMSSRDKGHLRLRSNFILVAFVLFWQDDTVASGN